MKTVFIGRILQICWWTFRFCKSRKLTDR